MQAFGAIIALAVAIFVPIWIARNRERLSRRRFLESVAAIGNEARECFVIAAMKCGDQTAGQWFVRSVDALHRFNIASAAINAIPVHQLPSYAITSSVLEQVFASAFNNLATRADDPLRKLIEAERSV